MKLAAKQHAVASESQTLAMQTHFVIWHARDIGVIGISNQLINFDECNFNNPIDMMSMRLLVGSIACMAF